MPAGKTPEFTFLGVVCTEPDYRLSVLINRHLRTDLRKNPDEITISHEQKTVSFSRFTTAPATLSLVSNHSQGIALINKLKNIDFLIVIHGDADKGRAEEFAAMIRKMPEVTAVFVFESSSVNDRNLSLLIG